MTRPLPFPGDAALLRRLRLAAQRLTGTPAETPAAAVSHLLALQGQDLPGAKWSVALRTGGAAATDAGATGAGATETEVDAALDAAAIVRSWPLRGTLHLTGPADLHWLLDLTAERSLATAAGRRAILGITEADVERAREIAVAALPGRTTLGRDALLAAIAGGGVDTSGQRGYHILWYLSQSGSLVMGPADGNQQAFARLDAWVPRPPARPRPEALAELAVRYFESHGPATVADLARWTGLTVRELRQGIEAAGDRLAAFEFEGAAVFVAAGALAAPAPEPRVLLLPGFDEYVLGYGDRSAILAPQHANAIVPGNNGMFKATIVAGGEIVGTWSRRRTARADHLDLAPFRPLTPAELDSAEEAAAAFGRFLGRPVQVGRIAG